MIALAVVRDGVLYRAPCFTPYGDLPYCDEQRFGVWSVTKTAVAAVGMLALAQKYSPEVFDLPVLEYVAAQPPHDGWDGVTIGDALNMATGLGEGSEVTEPNNSGDGYLVRYEWYDEESAGEKVVAVLDATEHPWGPGRSVPLSGPGHVPRRGRRGSLSQGGGRTRRQLLAVPSGRGVPPDRHPRPCDQPDQRARRTRGRTHRPAGLLRHPRRARPPRHAAARTAANTTVDRSSTAPSWRS